MPACDGQTDGRTDGRQAYSYYVLQHMTHVKNGPFDVSGAHFKKNIWQLLMVLFQFVPKLGIFDGFQLLGTPKV